MSSLLRTTAGKRFSSLRRASFAVACLGLMSSGLLARDADATNRSSDPWKRLAERAIAQSAPQRVTLRPGIIDPALRSAIPPIPKGWVAIGTVDRTLEPFGNVGLTSAPVISQVYFDVPSAAFATLSQWHERFLANGWTLEPPNTTNGQTANATPQFRTYCRASKAISVIWTATAASTGVTVTALNRPCGQPAMPPQVTEFFDAMRPPRLIFPPTVTVTNQKSGTGSPTSDTADYTLQTPVSVGELHALTAKQMTAIGWVKDETASTPSLIISRWRKDIAGATIAAFVYVSTAPGPDRRTVSVTTRTEAVVSELSFGGEIFAPPAPPTTKA